VTGDGDSRNALVVFGPNYLDADGNPVNRSWSLATPHLNLNMTLNGAAAELFTAGQDYTLTFEVD
jgi:hypothetical protein